MKLDLKSQWREEWKKDATSFPLTKVVETNMSNSKIENNKGIHITNSASNSPEARPQNSKQLLGPQKTSIASLVVVLW